MGPNQCPVTDDIQHSQETDIHAYGGTGTHNTSKRSGADPRLEACDICDRPAATLRMRKLKGVVSE
jgi:hypothetical protein